MSPFDKLRVKNKIMENLKSIKIKVFYEGEIKKITKKDFDVLKNNDEIKIIGFL